MPAKVEIRSTNEIREVRVPRVTYLGNINKENSPYSLYINGPLFGQLLQEEFGLTLKQIEKLDIVVVGRGGKDRNVFDDVAGKVSLLRGASGRRKIWVYPEVYYRGLIRMRKTFLRYSRKDWEKFKWRRRVVRLIDTKRASNYAKEFLVTKRFLPYLNQVSTARSEEFLDKLISNVMGRKFLELLVHEAKHIVDLKKGKFLFLTYPLKIGVMVGSMIAIDLGVLASLVGLGAKESELSDLWIGGSLGLATVLGGTTFYWMRDNLPPVSERAAKIVAKEVKNKYRWSECVKFQINEKQDL